MSTLENALDKLEKAIGRLEAAQAAAETARPETTQEGFDAEELAKAAADAQSENLDLLAEREQVAARIDKVIGRLNGMLEDDA